MSLYEFIVSPEGAMITTDTDAGFERFLLGYAHQRGVVKNLTPEEQSIVELWKKIAPAVREVDPGRVFTVTGVMRDRHVPVMGSRKRWGRAQPDWERQGRVLVSFQVPIGMAPDTGRFLRDQWIAWVEQAVGDRMDFHMIEEDPKEAPQDALVVLRFLGR